MAVDERIAALLSVPFDPESGKTASTGDPVTMSEDFSVPEYVYIDTFDELDQAVWTKESVNRDLSLEIKRGRLQLSGKYREGRLNSINSISTRSVKHKSFAVEIAFRDLKSSVDTISLTVGNDDWMRGGYLQVTANFKKEYYYFRWADKGSWYSDDENFYDDIFGDEDKEFHILKIVFDKKSGTASGYVDDMFLGKTEDFAFLVRDKIHISFSVSESVRNTKKDVLVEFDNFKCSLNLKK
jgi:hypothetical protein